MTDGWKCEGCGRMWREDDPAACPDCGREEFSSVAVEVREKAPGVDVDALKPVNLSRVGPEEAAVEPRGDGYRAAAECPHCGGTVEWRMDALDEERSAACPGCGAGFELELEDPDALQAEIRDSFRTWLRDRIRSFFPG